MPTRKYFNTLRFTKEDGVIDHGLIGNSWGKEESGGSILFNSPSCISFLNSKVIDFTKVLSKCILFCTSIF